MIMTAYIPIKARRNGCEEASLQSIHTYIPCNAPAVVMVGYKYRSEGPYRMCAVCADHNVRNRGGTVLGPYEAVGLPECCVLELDDAEQEALAAITGEISW